MTANEICKALECCSTECDTEKYDMCDECPYHKYEKELIGSCIQQMCSDAIELIKKQQEKIEELNSIKQLNEQDIADRDEMLKQKVEVVYEDFMKDYKCILEENEGLYGELALLRAENEILRSK